MALCWVGAAYSILSNSWLFYLWRKWNQIRMTRGYPITGYSNPGLKMMIELRMRWRSWDEWFVGPSIHDLKNLAGQGIWKMIIPAKVFSFFSKNQPSTFWNFDLDAQTFEKILLMLETNKKEGSSASLSWRDGPVGRKRRCTDVIFLVRNTFHNLKFIFTRNYFTQQEILTFLLHPLLNSYVVVQLLLVCSWIVMVFIGLSVTGVISSPHLKKGDLSKLTNGLDYKGKLSVCLVAIFSRTMPVNDNTLHGFLILPYVYLKEICVAKQMLPLLLEKAFLIFQCHTLLRLEFQFAWKLALLKETLSSFIANMRLSF